MEKDDVSLPDEAWLFQNENLPIVYSQTHKNANPVSDWKLN